MDHGSHDPFALSQTNKSACCILDHRLKGRAPLAGYHIKNVNAYASGLKTWMVCFRGIATKYLDSYLGRRGTIDRETARTRPRRTISWPPSHRLLRQCGTKPCKFNATSRVSQRKHACNDRYASEPNERRPEQVCQKKDHRFGSKPRWVKVHPKLSFLHERAVMAMGIVESTPGKRSPNALYNFHILPAAVHSSRGVEDWKAPYVRILHWMWLSWHRIVVFR
jgi:hypothetical protein